MAAPHHLFLMGLAVTMASSSSAFAAAPAPPTLSTCKVKGVDVTTATAEKLPKDGKREVFHLVAPKNRRFLAFVGPRGRCTVIPVKRAAARAWGNFWPGKGRVKAFVLEDPGCVDKESDCTSVLAFKQKKSATMLGAFRIRGCDFGHKATALRMTATLDSLQVDCHSSVGAGDYSVSATVFMLANNRLRKVLNANLGHVQQGSEPGPNGTSLSCTRGPEGYIKAVTRKGIHLLETLEPGHSHDDDPGMGAVKRWRFDPETLKFRRHGRTREGALRTRKRCRPMKDD